MSWIDELITQIGEASNDGGSPADAIPSDPATADTFVPGKDSADASKYFQTFFGGEAPDTSSMGAPGPEYGSAAQDSQRANEALGLSADTRMPSVAGMGEKAAPSFIEALLGRTGLKKTKDGETDWSDPATMNAAMKLIGFGANLTGMLARRGQPEGYKSATQLRSDIMGPNNNWNPQQQATADAFFGKPMQGAASHQLQFASTMPSPIVPGRGYADGGPISPLVNFSSASPSYAAYGGTPTGALGAAVMPAPPQSAPISQPPQTIPTSPGGPGGPRGPMNMPMRPMKPDHPMPRMRDPRDPRAMPMRTAVVSPMSTFSPQASDPVAGHDYDYGQMGDWINGTGALGQAHNQLSAWTALNNAALSGSGHVAYSVADPNGWDNMISSSSDPMAAARQIAQTQGWTMPGMRRGGAVAGYGHGGALGHIQANTGGQDDVVPINAAGGEYMWDADTVSALGDGNNAAGARKLDVARENIRAHKRSAPKNKIPPRAKPLGQYMNGGN